MILGPRDRPKSIGMWIILSIQHLFAMFGATVLTPLLINSIAGEVVITTDLAIFASGVGTLIYILCTVGKVPIYLGSSFAYIAAIGSMYKIYGTSAFFGLLGVGLVYVIVALIIYFFGIKWIKKLLAPVVVGPMIMIIGLSVAPVAISQIGLTEENVSKGLVDWWGVVVGVITSISGMLIALLCKGKMKLVPILGAIVVGFVVSLIISSWHSSMIPYSSFKGRELSTYIGVPNFKNAIIAGKHASFGTSNGWSFWPFILMMPIAFVTIAEHIGDHTVLGKITNKDYINNPGLHKTLLGDGLATAFGGLVGGPANTSYGENTTVVGMSKIASTYVTGLAAIFAILLSFIQLVPNTIALIPKPVLGGVGVLLFGFIAANGLKILIQDNVDLGNLKNLFVVLTMLILGVGGATLGFFIKGSAVMLKGMSIALIVGIILNLALPEPRPINPNVFDKLTNSGRKKDIKNINKNKFKDKK
ncbi:xanthine permease [Mycoplasma marinum]|uniref:Xanthine permease n=2 Tax=Mycoplasma marinum TaxID=1937190 RepID=A0A4R0XSA1_9MOLU|nr:xanthine permease [Mycoplasma marinum]